MLDHMTDEEVLAHIKKLGTIVSMYEAAEGESYRLETELRIAAKQNFWTALGLARERGLDPDTKGFLL